MFIGKSNDLFDISSAISRKYKNPVRFQSLQHVATCLGKVLLFTDAPIEISHRALKQHPVCSPRTTNLSRGVAINVNEYGLISGKAVKTTIKINE